MNELALFAGAGGGILGGHLLGWRTVCAVEWEPYAASVLAQRQNDGLLPAFPIWDDVQTFDGRPWRGVVDVVSGGFPCQDISVAGKGAGIEGSRSGMWTHMARIIGEVRPRFAFVENSPALLARGLGVVLSDLAALGYDCKWTVLGASDVRAPHRRYRLWIVANTRSERHELTNKAIRTRRDTVEPGCEISDPINHWNKWRIAFSGSGTKAGDKQPGAEWWIAEPDVGRMADGVAARVDRLGAIGNGQVPLCAAKAWRLLTTQPKDQP